MTLRAPLITRVPRPGPPRALLESGARADGLVDVLRGQDTFFGAAGDGPTYDWPNPVVRPFPVVLRTWTQSPRLLGQDAFFAGAGRGPVFAWPNPQVRVSTPSWDAPNLLTSTLAEAAPPATFITRPPLITRIPRARWIAPDTAPNLLATTLAQGPPAATPFTQADWPVPRGARAAIQLRTWTDPLRQNLLGQDEFFAGPGGGANTIDAGNPMVARPHGQLRGWSQNLLETTLYTAPPAPFAQQEWPLPGRKKDTVALRTWLQPLKPQLLGQDEFFAGPGRGPTYEWATPRERLAVAPPWSAPNLLQTTLAQLTPAPFAQSEWPNPRAPGYAISLKFQASWIAPLGGAGTAPLVIGTRLIRVRPPTRIARSRH